MKKLFIAAIMSLSMLTTGTFADGHSIKMGIILGFTGPIGIPNTSYGSLSGISF